MTRSTMRPDGSRHRCLLFALAALVAATPLAAADSDADREEAPQAVEVEGAAAAETNSNPLAESPPIPKMNAEDYRLYKNYERAMRDPRVQAMAASSRMPAIARNFSVPLTRLREVVEFGDQYAEGQLDMQKAAARKALEATPLEGRIRHLRFHENRRGIVVAYVGWQTTCADSLIPEAAHMAKAVADAAPVAELVAVWACMGRRKAFSARIQTSSAANISVDRIEDFAETRYIRLFEEVRNLFGDEPPEDDLGCP